MRRPKRAASLLVVCVNFRATTEISEAVADQSSVS